MFLTLLFTTTVAKYFVKLFDLLLGLAPMLVLAAAGLVLSSAKAVFLIVVDVLFCVFDSHGGGIVCPGVMHLCIVLPIAATKLSV